MSEPEEVLIEAAHVVTRRVSDLWHRNRAGPRSTVPELADVKRRLELFAAAICVGSPPIVAAEPPLVPGLVARLLKGIPRHLAERDPLASTDGARIRLPRRLEGLSAVDTLDLYRLLTLEQAMRATRGTPDHLPSEPALRDLYLLSEAVAIDRRIAIEVPGLRPMLVRERRRARDGRAELRRLTRPEQAVERWLRAVLDAAPEAAPEPVELAEDPAGSLAWARATCPLLAPGNGRYRGLPAVALWGRTEPPPNAIPASEGQEQAPSPRAPERVGAMTRRPKVREAGDDEDDAAPGICMVPTQDRQEKAEDPMGLSRPADRGDDAEQDELADALSELPEARLVRTSDAPREVLASDDPPPTSAALLGEPGTRAGIRYPEWDHRRAGYRPDHVTVWLAPPGLSSPEEAGALARRNAPLVTSVRRRFERCKPRRLRQGRQTDGPDVDLDAFVSSFADRRAGGPVDDRLYEVHRPLRRELAISLLVDVSASTDGWVSERLRIVDVERDALLVVAEALDALGDRYAIVAFSGEGPSGVVAWHLKEYDERYGEGVQRRIAALEPQHFTRLGAAVRHATARLVREAVGHRLLLVLSDGKPNDVDEYEGRYGIEDARMAVVEARMQHIHPFCLTVDHEAPAYMPQIFGPVGFATLRRAAALPGVLVDVINRMIRT